MKDPPDPGDEVPPAGLFVTVLSNESGMETDNSISNRSRKRSRLHVCKHCNKKRRHLHGSDVKVDHNDCHCNISPRIDNVKEKSVTEPNTSVSTPASSSLSFPPMPPAPSPIGRLLYNETDIAPFVIHVQRIESAPNDGSFLHPVTFGRFLKNTRVENIVNGSIKRIGRNKITISFSTYTSANSFIQNKNLESQKMKAFLPTFNVTRMGLIRGIPSEWSPEDILDNISVPIGCGKIIKVRRINYKVFQDGSVLWKPSQAVVVTFDGQVLPKRIFVCFNALPVDLYIYPTIQCYNCCRFGHTKTQCRSKPRCFKCGENHTGESCNKEENVNAICCSCEGSHFATNKSCPEYKRQQEIKNYMAHNCTSYAEASKCFPSVSKLYSYVAANSSSSNKPTFSKQSAQNLPESMSYKKTVFLKPRSPPRLGPGYDVESHNDLIKDYNMPSPANGCGFSKTDKEPESQVISVSELIKLILNLFNCFNTNSTNINTPTNVASIITTIIQSLQSQNGQSS